MNRKQHAEWLRWTRKVHRLMGIFLFVIFLAISITGLLLGWKKNSGDWLMPPTQTGTSQSLADWLPLDSLEAIAMRYYYVQDETLTIDRMDIRPDKGIVKVLFKQYNLELQLDGASGKILSVGKRRSDWIEHLHDGSLFDDLLGVNFFKLIFTSIAGISLFLFSVTGFWLWYGPKVMRKAT